MRMKFKIIILFICFAFFAGCAGYNHTNMLADNNNKNYEKYLKYSRDDFVGGFKDPQPTIEKRNHFFVFGLAQKEEIDAINMCREKGFNKVNLIINEKRWYDGVLTLITIGIYAPTHTYIWCE